MNPVTESEPAPSVLRWTGDATIESVAGLRCDLLGAVTLGADVTVCLGDVTRIDTAALQLLVAARATLARAGRALRLGEMSDAVKDAVRLSGLAELIAPAAPTG